MSRSRYRILDLWRDRKLFAKNDRQHRDKVLRQLRDRLPPLGQMLDRKEMRMVSWRRFR